MSEPLRPKLRIGLLVDSFMQPRWVARIVSDLKNSTIAETVLVVQNRCGQPESKGVIRRLWERRNYLLYAAYTKLDERRSQVDPDAFEKICVEELMTGVPVLEVTPIMNRFTDRLSDEDINLIREYRLDVALRFGFRILKGEILKTPRYGIWSYHHDDGSVIRGGPPGFWEIMTDADVTGSMLQIINEELDNGQVIYRSWSPTIDKFSVKRNNNNYYWKTASFVMRKLSELHRSGEVSEDQNRHLAEAPYSSRLYRTPTNSEMFGLLLGLLRRGFSRGVEKLNSRETWSLAYRFRDNPADLNNSFYKFKFLRPPSGRFWADPFPVKVGDRYFVFFEEFLYQTNKAHISLIELGKGQKPTAPVTVLERPYHLSYPFIFEWKGTHYMIPETGDNGTVELYRCKTFPHEWEFEKVLLEARNPTDATLIEFEGRWWMFVNIEEPGVRVNWEELHLFHADSPLGPWTPHSRNPIKSDVRNSRPAGRLFYKADNLYRPAQDCSKRYGYATVINKVTRMTPDEYVEEEVARITPDWDKKVIGTHTLNSADELTVIDCLLRDSRFYQSPDIEFARSSNAVTETNQSSKENVLQFIHSFIDGGSERQMIQLTKLLLESGKYRVHVACLSDEGFLKPEIERLGFDQIREFPLTSFYDTNMAVQLRRFSAYLKANNIRLIQTHDFYSNIFGMAGAALAGIPVRIASRRETEGMRTAAQKRAELLAFKLAKSIVTNAEAVKATLVSEGVSSQKINVIHNGLDLQRLTPRPLSYPEKLALLGLPPDINEGQHRLITIVANMRHEVKDHSMFLRAAQRVHEAVPEARFLLAGEGKLVDSIRSLANDLGLGDVTFFLGRCVHVPELLSISDVCVLSSKAEGFSNSILEYMAAARPVVATNVGGAAEAVIEGQTGFLVPSGDHEAMAQRIISLLRDPKTLGEMGQRARQLVETNYSCASQLRKTEMLYESLLPQNGRQGN